jgi:hypothetical protein
VGGGRDVFVHISAVERAGLSCLNEGQVVEYEEVSNRGSFTTVEQALGKTRIGTTKERLASAISVGGAENGAARLS